METEIVPILLVADADAAVRWYQRLGFTKQWEHRSVNVQVAVGGGCG